MSEVTAWQYPVVFFDVLRVKIHEDAMVRSKAVYLALGILPDGGKDIPVIWIASPRREVLRCCEFNDLKSRGGNDNLIVVTDGLKGRPGALGAAFPANTLQNFIVHLIRNTWTTPVERIAGRWRRPSSRSAQYPALGL